MSRNFYAINKITGERWKPDLSINEKEYLVLFDSGSLGVVSQQFYTYIRPLDPKIWETKFNKSILSTIGEGL